MGVSRYFPEAERLLLEYYGMQYKPDLILLAFVPNDVMDTSAGIEGITVSSDGHLISREASSLGAIGVWLYRSSHLGRILIGAFTAKVSSMKHPQIWEEIYQSNGFHESDWQRVELEYLRIRELVERLNAKLLLVNIPMSSDVDGGPKMRYPGQRLGKFAARHSIAYVDVLPAMVEAKKQLRVPLYWEKDGHCTSEGYRVIGEAIFARLVQERLVPH
jgi:hypothetical protein